MLRGFVWCACFDAYVIIIPAFILFFNKYRESPGYLEKREISKRQNEYDLICRQNEYTRTISTEKFINWQYKLLEFYYKENKENKYFTSVFNEEYPVYIFKGINYKYPFTELLQKNKLKCGKNHKNYISGKKIKKSKYYKEYFQIMQPQLLPRKYQKVQRPLMQGFMLDKLIIKNGYVSHLNAWAGTYAQNVYTSHILEYENYVLFKKYADKKTGFKKIKRKMTLRNRIHKNKKIIDVLESGCNRASLLIIQLIVLIYNPVKDEYEILFIKRSEDVAERSGFFQFVPTGGFEILGTEVDCSENELIKNFNVVYTIFREFAEEVFNEESFEKGKPGETADKVLEHDEVKKIIDMIQNGKAHMEFLGSIAGLISLKNELSFVLRIDDEKYYENVFHANFEGKDILRKTVSEFDKLMEEKNAGGASNKKLFNPPSAALYKLLKENHLYKDIVKKRLTTPNGENIYFTKILQT